MTIDELKKALVEVHNICKAHEDVCGDCPFGMDTSNGHICFLSPSLYENMIPEKWAVSGWDCGDEAGASADRRFGNAKPGT